MPDLLAPKLEPDAITAKRFSLSNAEEVCFGD